VLSELGWSLTEAEVVERFVGRSDSDTKAAIEAHLGRRLPAGWDARYRRLCEEAFADALAPVDGVLEALDRITLPSCVASSGTHEHLRYTLGLTGLFERFAGRIFSAEDVARGKPAPDLFLHAAERMGFQPGACVVVEDSRSGVEAARAAGMRVLAFAGGLTSAVLLDGPNTVVFEDMRELPGLLSAMARPRSGDRGAQLEWAHCRRAVADRPARHTRSGLPPGLDSGDRLALSSMRAMARITAKGGNVARVMADCRRFESDVNCSLTIIGEEDEVVAAAAQHAEAVHQHADTPELRDQIRAMLEPEGEYAPGDRAAQPFPS
jgi:HAD superfamily hydrolase (TIGR01509 family)